MIKALLHTVSAALLFLQPPLNQMDFESPAIHPPALPVVLWIDSEAAAAILAQLHQIFAELRRK